MSGVPMRVTVLGGGNGISTVLEGLARRLRLGVPLDLTAVVATSDDGGSSGRLRRQRGGLPPGDLRRCLLALAGNDRRGFAELFAHRYDGEDELAGHAVGNLVLSALADRYGCYLRAVEEAARMLGACGRVLPVTLRTVGLTAVTRDGRALCGESNVGNAPSAIDRVALTPPDAEPGPGVLDAIAASDLVVVGPGSLFTSVLPVLLVPGVSESVHACRGTRVLVANLMTEPGETLDMDLADHLEALDRHVGPGLVRYVLANDAPVDAERLKPYAALRSTPVVVTTLNGRAERFSRVPLVTPSGKIRHDPDRLAAGLLALVESAQAADSPGGGIPERIPAARPEAGYGGLAGEQEGSH